MTIEQAENLQREMRPDVWQHTQHHVNCEAGCELGWYWAYGDGELHGPFETEAQTYDDFQQAVTHGR